MCYPHVYDYLMATPNNIDGGTIEAFKSLESVNQLMSGWVDTVYYHHIHKQGPFCYVRCQGRSSQKINEKSHQPIAILEKKSGKVRYAVCTCMAGLRETYAHVAALLFKIELGALIYARSVNY